MRNIPAKSHQNAATRITTIKESTETPDMMGGDSVTEERSNDNILELNVTGPQFQFAADWNDGEQYTLKNVVVNQTSPGRFVVISAEGGDEEEAENADNPAEEAAEEGAETRNENSSFPNPAVARMMSRTKMDEE